jgi:hypothetical protein
MKRLHLSFALEARPPLPTVRRLRVFAFDPSLQTDISNFGINQTTIDICWEEDLQPGPVGEYVEVIDVDPASGCCYAPVDLNHPHLLAENGLQPSEANPQFHQQMSYAVAMRTIARFEFALGRRALWAQRIVRGPRGVTSEYVRRLRIYPHALREENAYYSRDHMALLFGYFNAQSSDVGMNLPGARVFCAVSHDIIAHETTHALLDGLHPRYQEATNPDLLAFHEAFADIIALFQHFAMPRALLHQVKKLRGKMSDSGPLNEIARQFGTATGMHGALRSFVGKTDPDAYRKFREQGEPHALGAVLVSAVFAAFVTIYTARTADLLRLASGGTGILPDGDIPQDLAERLAREAAKVANQVLNICIRALDYCPPVDLNFGDYLRAIITADHDLVPEDDRGYRVAFISAFRDRGIFPTNVRHLAEDSLVWEAPPALDEVEDLIEQLDLRWSLNSKREDAYETSKTNALKVRQWLTRHENLRQAMGFEPPKSKTTIAGMSGELRPIEIHSVRPCRRTAPNGTTHAMLVMEITQTFRADPDQARYRGGCTLLVDLNTNKASYIIRKRLASDSGALAQKNARVQAAVQAAALGLRYAEPGAVGAGAEPFALLHRCAPRG